MVFIQQRRERTEVEDSDSDGESEYRLAAPEDFSEFCKLIESGEATSQHHKEFDLRMIGHFCDRIYLNKKPESWVMEAIANAFFKVIHGGRWEDEFQLPWTESSSPWTKAENKDLQIFCAIANRLKSNPNFAVTEAIKLVASENATSYEKARAAYYRHKPLIK